MLAHTVNAALQRIIGEMRLDGTDLRLQRDLQNSQIQGGFLLRLQFPLQFERQAQVILADTSHLLEIINCQIIIRSKFQQNR